MPQNYGLGRGLAALIPQKKQASSPGQNRAPANIPVAAN